MDKFFNAYCYRKEKEGVYVNPNIDRCVYWDDECNEWVLCRSCGDPLLGVTDYMDLDPYLLSDIFF